MLRPERDKMGQGASKPAVNNVNNSDNHVFQKKHKLVLITASPCGACRVFTAKHKNNLMADLSNIPIVEFVNIHLPVMNHKLIPKHANQPIPRVIPTLAKWYPFIMMVPYESWTRGLVENINPSEIDIYDPRKDVSGNPKDGRLTTNDIMKWINKKLDEPKYQKLNVPKEIKKIEPTPPDDKLSSISTKQPIYTPTSSSTAKNTNYMKFKGHNKSENIKTDTRKDKTTGYKINFVKGK